MAYDLGQITHTSQPVFWAVGFDRDPAVTMTDLSGNTRERALFYKTNFTDGTTLVRVYLHTAWLSINNTKLNCFN